MSRADTIAAIATASGRGGIGVVRVSGNKAGVVAQAVLRKAIQPRDATFTAFHAANGDVLDKGIAIFFSGPNSYTGEDVLELQAHGGQALLALLLNECLGAGARLAHPGEFTERAFLNGKLDLAQAEAVADLIDASSAEAARSAARSMVGEFSKAVDAIKASLIELRMHIEACIDFPEEEIDPANRRWQAERATALQTQTQQLLQQARQGSVLRDGLTVVLVGAPNVGKSSLLNRLAGEEVAIVTPIAGTTRDTVKTTIHLNGVPLHLIDTAGIRETTDLVEQIGIERTWQAVAQAKVVLVLDAPDESGEAKLSREVALSGLASKLSPGVARADIHNKRDLGVVNDLFDGAQFSISAKTGEGVDALKAWLLQQAGYQPGNEGVFMARERHITALLAVESALARSRQQLASAATELAAEELRLAQDHLSEITGEFTPDDLLGEIFSRFCIGK
jgi:tRNA modification GTPase